jgi:DNA (cytosine-5)-methyltransferase 1
LSINVLNAALNLTNINMNPYAWSIKDLDSVPKNNLKVMSTFACGGGSSLGYKRAGCDVVAANDIDPEMAFHYKLNLNPKHYFLCPIRDLLTAKLPQELFNLDILDGSPPCSTFSLAGIREKSWGKNKMFREGQTKQVLSDLFFDYLDLVGFLRPKVAIAENVKGLVLGNAKGYTKLIMNRFRELGYRPQLFLINAADCGVPQRRERVFFCAVQEQLTDKVLEINPAYPWIAAQDAIADCCDREDSPLTPTHRKYWSSWVPGTSLGDVYKSRGDKIKGFTDKKMQPDKPSLTLTANAKSYVHWKSPRYLNLAEWKRLGSFPDDYQVKNANIGKYLIGMSVPPKMAEVVAKAVINQWLIPEKT